MQVSLSVRSERKTIRSLNLTGMKLTHGMSFRVLRDDEGNSIFELVTSHGMPVMAFLYKKFSPRSLSWKREVFGKLTIFGSDQQIDADTARAMVPVQEVESLPDREMWQAGSTFGEDAFWASPQMRLEVTTRVRGGCYVNVIHNNYGTVAYFDYPDKQPDNDTVLTFVMQLRKHLHLTQAIRVESRLEHKVLCWYIPKTLMT